MDSLEFKMGAALIDMDGTLTNSLATVERLWRIWSDRYDVPIEEVLQIIHGRPSAEATPILLPELTSAEQQQAADFIEDLEVVDTEGVTAQPGAKEFLQSLTDLQVPHAVVTSATVALLESRMSAAGLPIPANRVTVELISNGKPDPECFLLAAQTLSVRPADCVVFEDSEAGIRAGLRAGMRVVGVGPDAPAARNLLLSEGVAGADDRLVCVPDLSYIRLGVATVIVDSGIA